MPLRTLHAVTAIVLSSFAAVHVANHVAALWGVEAHLAFMDAARVVYRHPVAETALLLSVLVQVGSGGALFLRGRGKRHDPVSRVQALSGAYLLFFLHVHVGAVLVGRTALGLNTNVYFAAAGFHVPPFHFFFAPYYMLGVLALFAHGGCALYWRVQGSGQVTARSVLTAPIAVGAVLGVLIVSALAGAFHAVRVPAEYTAPFTSLRQPFTTSEGTR